MLVYGGIHVAEASILRLVASILQLVVQLSAAILQAP
jgi:hypothetical protein